MPLLDSTAVRSSRGCRKRVTAGSILADKSTCIGKPLTLMSTGRSLANEIIAKWPSKEESMR